MLPPLSPMWVSFFFSIPTSIPPPCCPQLTFLQKKMKPAEENVFMLSHGSQLTSHGHLVLLYTLAHFLLLWVSCPASWNKAEVDVFLEFSWFFCVPTDVGNLISGSSASSKSSLNIWKFLVHVLLKHYFANVWNECNCVVVWTFFGIVFLWDWNENWPFPVLWPMLSFPNLLTYWVQHFHSIIF